MRLTRSNQRQGIPKSAKKAFGGKIFSVYQWQQKEFDGSKKTYEGLKRNDSVEVYPITDDGNIMLGIQTQPDTKTFISGFGGRIEAGENPQEAAKREFLEETGYKFTKLIPWFSTQPMGRIDWVIHVFIAKGITKIDKPNLDPGEKIKIVIVDFDKFINLTAQDNFRNWTVCLEIYKNLIKQGGLLKLKQFLCM